MKLFGIEPNLLNESQDYIPTIAFADFLTHVAEKYHCPDLGSSSLNIGRRQVLAS
jgi:hypothetical protein